MGVFEIMLQGATIQEVAQLLIESSDRLNADEYPVLMELASDELDQETTDKRGLRGALIEMICRINADPSVLEDAHVRAILGAMKEVSDVRDARKIAAALKNVRLPADVFEPRPSRRTPSASPGI